MLGFVNSYTISVLPHFNLEALNNLCIQVKPGALLYRLKIRSETHFGNGAKLKYRTLILWW